MDLNNTIRNLREEFGKQLDNALADEVRQRKLDEKDLETLVDILPEVVIPQLSATDEKKALKLKDDLDKKVDRLAELTAEIGQVSGDYRKQVGELHGLLMGKKHSVYTSHTKNRTTFMLKTISRILANDTVNAAVGLRVLPDQASIHRRIGSYTGN